MAVIPLCTASTAQPVWPPATTVIPKTNPNPVPLKPPEPQRPNPTPETKPLAESNTTVVPKTKQLDTIQTPYGKELPPMKYNPYILPPVEYDYPYQGKLTIEEASTIADLIKVCKLSRPWALGCAITRADNCHIVLVPENVIIAYGWTRKLMLRHEIGHCNGWPGDHPGQRRYDAE